MSLSKIVVGVDGSPIGQRAVAFAVDLAGSLGIELVAVHAFEPLSMIGKVPPPLDFAALEAAARAQLEGAWTDAARTAGVPVTCRLVEDNPVHALAAVAAEVEASMIVIGARGLSPLKGLVLGSTSSQLPQLAGCPVTIVPGD